MPKPHEFLRDAVEAARAALRDMDAKEVPSKLRRVAASSERSLPRPLADAVLRELGTDEFLREKALEAWPGERPPAGGPLLASYVFLERAQGWEIDLVREAAASGERHGAATDHSLEMERDSLAADVASLREQLKRVKAESSARERELMAALDAERAPGRSERRGEHRLSEMLEAERERLAALEAESAGQIAAREEEIRRLKEVARSEREARSEVAAALQTGGMGSLPDDPIALARLLDDLVAHASSFVAPPPEPRPGSGGAVTPLAPFDASLRPDRAEAVDWLIGAGPATVLVDGYNLGFALAGLDSVRARALAIEASNRLATAAPDATVTVVFDSTVDVVDESAREGRSGSVVVAYTSGEIADDDIVTRAESSDRVVVFTNDRDLRHRIEAHGAIGLWADSLVEWSRRR